MVKLIVFAFLLQGVAYVHAQDESSGQEIVQVYTFCTCGDSDPEFYGENKALEEWFQDRIHKIPPPSSSDLNFQTIYIDLLIDENGLVHHQKIHRCPSPEMRKSLLKLIGIMPPWKPAEVKSIPVKSKVRIPLRIQWI